MSWTEEWQHLKVPLGKIELATNNFTTLIGKGGFGSVYKGELLTLLGGHSTVAVKRLDAKISGQGRKEFLMEVQLLSRYRHPNLISLLGFCEEKDEKILVYEYAEHGSLDRYLSSYSTLTWMQRLKICVGAARALDYLHNRVAEHHRVIHRDIKSSNILLDGQWEARVSDLGLSKIGVSDENDSFLISNPCGTLGYCDPVYIDTGVLTKESDVYSFGVVLFEVLCGRLCHAKYDDETRFLVPLAKRSYENYKLDEIIDPELRTQMDLGSLNTFSAIAYRCLLGDRRQRPSMSLVVEQLEESLVFQRKYEFEKNKKLSSDANDEPKKHQVSRETTNRSSSSSCSLSSSSSSSLDPLHPKSVYDFIVKDVHGNDVPLGNYNGKVFLIVNVPVDYEPSNCDREFRELNVLYDKYKDQGFEILAFPCDMLSAYPCITSEQTQESLRTSGKAKYPIFDKIEVNGMDASPLYKYLKSQKLCFFGNRIKMDMTMFLVNKEGKVVERHGFSYPHQMEKSIRNLLGLDSF